MLSNLFDQIKITDDIKISQALPLIENNREIFQEKGINLFLFNAYLWASWKWFTLFPII